MGKTEQFWQRAYSGGINREAFFGRLMRRETETNYRDILRETGERAAGAVEEIYGDLQERTAQLRSVEPGQRRAPAELVEGQYHLSAHKF